MSSDKSSTVDIIKQSSSGGFWIVAIILMTLAVSAACILYQPALELIVESGHTLNQTAKISVILIEIVGLLLIGGVLLDQQSRTIQLDKRTISITSKFSAPKSLSLDEIKQAEYHYMYGRFGGKTEFLYLLPVNDQRQKIVIETALLKQEDAEKIRKFINSKLRDPETPAQKTLLHWLLWIALFFAAIFVAIFVGIIVGFVTFVK